MKRSFVQGLWAGMPIGIGYLSVSFSFGILAVSLGLDAWQALLVSMLNLTSAGQLAGVQIMTTPAQIPAMILSQLTINLRYSFMAISLSQKVSERFRGIWRFLFGFFITDEIFAVAIGQTEVSRSFFAGLCVLPYLGWSCGTLLGALLGNVLPSVVLNALCLAIYAMFIAIVVPAVKQDFKLLVVVIAGIALACLFYYLPALSGISEGIWISGCAVLAAALGALLFPREEEETAE